MLRTSVHVVANVIDRHQHHDGATRGIHRLNTRGWYRLNGSRGSSHDVGIVFFMPAKTADSKEQAQMPGLAAPLEQKLPHCGVLG